MVAGEGKERVCGDGAQPLPLHVEGPQVAFELGDASEQGCHHPAMGCAEFECQSTALAMLLFLLNIHKCIA